MWLRTVLCALALSIALPVQHARAQNSETINTRFYPLFVQGELTGCQVAFSVVRLDHEFSGGVPTVVTGLLVAYGSRAERPGAMLRLGVAPVESPDDFRPPTRAFLVWNFRTNAPDVGQPFLSDTEGFRVFPYALGERTVDAIAGMTVSGQLHFSYGMPGTTVEAGAVADLNVAPDVLANWRDCINTALE